MVLASPFAVLRERGGTTINEEKRCTIYSGPRRGAGRRRVIRDEDVGTPGPVAGTGAPAPRY